MTDLARDRFRRVQDLFTEALGRSDGAREAFLAAVADAEIVAEVRRLLDAHARSATLFEETERAGERPGDLVGPYKLLEQIGEGGFGVVWVAEQQQPIVRRVAIKVVKPGMDTRDVLARFEAERQALALMDHPNIARVLDAGATALGRPYFVMELVRGIPLLEFCDRERLPAPKRLELFRQVCAAVQHAHQKGIVHRDLKPTNVMVTLHDDTPVCKVIDFGIAKAIQRKTVERTVFTAYGRFLGTPEYMAPEQSELSGLDVDTRADVYSLGVLLYELLTGSRPMDGLGRRVRDYLEIMRIVRDVEPERPSTRVSTLGSRTSSVAEKRGTTPRQLGVLLRGELDWIVMRALEKDRNRRYQTVAEFSDDVARFSNDEPVRARPPSRVYAIRKFVRRHRRAVAVAAIVLGSLVIGLGAAVTGWVDSRQARQLALASERDARASEARAQRLVTLLIDLLSASDPHAARGADFTVRELLDEFDESVATGLADEPEIEADLRLVVGESFLGLGLPDRAEPQFDRALALRRERFGDDDLRTVDVEVKLGGVAFARHDLERASGRFGRALAIREREFGREHAAVAELVAALGDVAMARHDWPEAERLHREALAIRRAVHGPDDRELAEGMNDLGAVLMNAGKLPEAADLYAGALEIVQRTVGVGHPHTLTARANLASVLLHVGELDRAEAEFRAVEVGFRAVSGDCHPSVAMTLENLAVVLMRKRQFRVAERVLRDALAIWTELGGGLDAAATNALQHLGAALLEQGRGADAEQVLEETLALFESMDLADSDPRVRWTRSDLEHARRLQAGPAQSR